jgi:hypothetical protein
VRSLLVKKNQTVKIQIINFNNGLYNYYENLRNSALQEICGKTTNNMGITLFLNKGMIAWADNALELLDKSPTQQTNDYLLEQTIAGGNTNMFIKTLVSMATSK